MPEILMELPVGRLCHFSRQSRFLPSKSSTHRLHRIAELLACADPSGGTETLPPTEQLPLTSSLVLAKAFFDTKEYQRAAAAITIPAPGAPVTSLLSYCADWPGGPACPLFEGVLALVARREEEERGDFPCPENAQAGEQTSTWYLAASYALLREKRARSLHPLCSWASTF
jgi:hypothetical protein